MSNSNENCKKFDLPEHLINTPGRTISPLKGLLNRSTSSVRVRHVSGSNPDGLAEWMSSIKKRALAALKKDDELEDQILSEIELQRRRKKEAEREETPLKSFNALGNVLFGLYSANRTDNENNLPKASEVCVVYLLFFAFFSDTK